MNEQNVIVERERMKFGKAFLDASDGVLYIANGHRVYFLKERCAASAIGDVEDDAGAASTGNNEISFGITDVLSCVDILGSFGDHPATVYGHFLLSAAMFLAEYLRAM